VAETLLNCFRVRAEADEQRRAGVPKVMEAKAGGESSPRDRRTNDALEEQVTAKWAAHRSRKHELVGPKSSTSGFGSGGKVCAEIVTN
jgi:hypothetical protein